MASKRKSPSFEIPDAVRQAGQAGWVYRTGDIPAKPKTTRPSAPLPRPSRDRLTPVADVVVAAAPAPEVATAESAVLIVQSEVTAEQSSAPPARAGARTLAGLIVSLSVQAVVALFVVPLYLVSGGCLAGSPDVK